MEPYHASKFQRMRRNLPFSRLNSDARRPRHQTEIVSGAHLGAGARIAYTRAMSEHRCFAPKGD